jgi:DNA primase
LKPSEFTIKTVEARLKKQKQDPWADFWTVHQNLRPEILKALKIEP